MTVEDETMKNLTYTSVADRSRRCSLGGDQADGLPDAAGHPAVEDADGQEVNLSRLHRLRHVNQEPLVPELEDFLSRRSTCVLADELPVQVDPRLFIHRPERQEQLFFGSLCGCFEP